MPGNVERLHERLALESAAERHLFALRRFEEEDPDLAEHLEPGFYGNPTGWLAEIEHAARVGWVGRLGEEYVGLVDFSVDLDEAMGYLSMYVVPAHRDQGVATQMLGLASRSMREVKLDLLLEAIVAQADSGNWAARRALAKAGFSTLGPEQSAMIDYVMDLEH